MNYKSVAIFLLLFLLNNIVFGQQYLSLKEGSCSTKAGYLDKVLVYDNRENKTDTLGRIKVDYRKGYEALFSKSSISKDISTYYSTSIYKDKSLAKKSLVVVVYQFLIEEKISGIDDETAGFKYSADYFMASGDSAYQLFYSIDTNVFVQAYDATNPLLKSVEDVLCFGLQKTFKEHPASDHLFTQKELTELKANHIQYFKAYAQTQHEDGIYETWNDFLRGAKMKDFITKASEGTYVVYKTLKNGREQFRAPIHKVAVLDGNVYYVYNEEIKSVKKEGDDFKLVTNMLVNSDKKYESTYVGLSLLASTVMALAFPFSFSFCFYPMHSQQYVYKRFECKINPRTGMLIPLKHISDKELKEFIIQQRAAAKEAKQK